MALSSAYYKHAALLRLRARDYACGRKQQRLQAVTGSVYKLSEAQTAVDIKYVRCTCHQLAEQAHS